MQQKVIISYQQEGGKKFDPTKIGDRSAVNYKQNLKKHVSAQQWIKNIAKPVKGQFTGE